MHCPTCSATLASTSHGHACPDGHGAFVHRGDWFPNEGATFALGLAVLAKGAGVGCPGCGATTQHVANGWEELDVCDRCHGAWTDAATLTRWVNANPEAVTREPWGAAAALVEAYKAIRAVAPTA